MWSRLFHKQSPFATPSVADLANAILNASGQCIDIFGDTMSDDRMVLVSLEFIHFFSHLTNRTALATLGDAGRRKLHDRLLPCLFEGIVRGAVGEERVSRKEMDEGFSTFQEADQDREIIYSDITRYLPEDSERPLDGLALFSKLASLVVDGCGITNDELATDVGKAVIGVSVKAYQDLELKTLVEQAGREL